MKNFIKTLGMVAGVVGGLTAIVLLLLGLIYGFDSLMSTNAKESSMSSDEMFMVLEDHSLSGYCIVYDKDTKIMYYRGVSTGACLDPLYNTDGTLKLYNGGN